MRIRTRPPLVEVFLILFVLLHGKESRKLKMIGKPINTIVLDVMSHVKWKAIKLPYK